MTLKEFGALIATVDPKARRYQSAQRGDFTVWEEYSRIPAYADGRTEGGWHVQLERYTKKEDDEIAEALRILLESRDDVAFSYMIDTEKDGESLTIRHLFDCEVW